MTYKFNPRKLERLNDPERLIDIPPGYIWQTLAVPECRTIVDVGAGTGIFSKAFLELLDGGTVYAADVAPVMIEWMTEHVVPDHPQIKPLLMEDSNLPLDDAIADLAILINLYHELDRPVATLTEIARVLRPGGTVCIIDWKKEETDHGPPVQFRFTAEEIASEIRSAGFMDIHTDLSMRNHSMVWARKP